MAYSAVLLWRVAILSFMATSATGIGPPLPPLSIPWDVARHLTSFNVCARSHLQHLMLGSILRSQSSVGSLWSTAILSRAIQVCNSSEDNSSTCPLYQERTQMKVPLLDQPESTLRETSSTDLKVSFKTLNLTPVSSTTKLTYYSDFACAIRFCRSLCLSSNYNLWGCSHRSTSF